MIRFRHLAWPLAVLLSLMAPTALGRAEGGAPQAGPNAPRVSVVEAATREIVQTIAVTGALAPREEILVSPEIEGFRVAEVLAEEGMRVERGQVLARLSRDFLDRQLAQQAAVVNKAEAAVPQAQSSIEQAEAVQIEARQAFDRAKSLMQSGNSTAATIEARTSALRQADGKLAFARNGLPVAQADLAQAQAVLDELKLRLARTDIRAPEAGIISRRTARVGMVASAAGEPMFRLIARGEIELEGEAIETKLPMLREGQTAFVDLGNGERVQGRVRAVYPEVDKATRVGKVRIALPPDPRLRIGAFASGTVEVARVRGVVLPQAAILYGDDQRGRVLVVSGETVESREVVTGIRQGGHIEVREGLRAGELVVARAGSFLKDGDRIRPVAAATSPIASAANDAETAARVDVR